MLFLNRGAMSAAMLIAIATMAGCATPPPAVQAEVLAPSHSMTEAQRDALGAQAEQAIAAADYAGAIILYQRIVKAYPNNAAAWYRMGIACLRGNQPELGQYAFGQALRADPSLTKSYANLALAHLTQFRTAAMQAVDSNQVAEANKVVLRSLLRDVDHALFPADAQPAAVKQ